MNILLFVTFISFAFAQSQMCGPTSSWNFNEKTNVLEIGGSGKMYDCDKSQGGWMKYKDRISTIRISSVTYVGKKAFSGMEKVTEVVISTGVEEIGD